MLHFFLSSLLGYLSALTRYCSLCKGGAGFVGEKGVCAVCLCVCVCVNGSHDTYILIILEYILST